jgi:hypothetical protein
MNALRTGLVPALVLALSLGSGVAFAQTAAPAPAAPAPAATAPMKAKKPAMTSDQKASISKACSAAADKQGLHGKPRAKFRSSCKSHGGPTG